MDQTVRPRQATFGEMKAMTLVSVTPLSLVEAQMRQSP